MIRTPVTDLLGIKYPLFQGGMAWIADGKLAAAVSSAGGLGIIAAGNAPASYVKEQIGIAKALTDKPFGVNIMLMRGAGNPSKYMDAWKACGIKVIPVVASVAMAKLMTRLGASALIAEGGESGGHVGELTTMVLTPLITAATNLPVLAAGGIATGCQAAAAFMLGAQGIQMGTRFLSAEECTISQTYREKILKAGDLCTMVTGKRLGHPVRSLRTAFAREYAKAEFGGMDDEELEKLGTGALRKAVVDGDPAGGCYLAGQVAAYVNRIESAKDIIEDVMSGAEECLRGASKWII